MARAKNDTSAIIGINYDTSDDEVTEGGDGGSLAYSASVVTIDAATTDILTIPVTPNALMVLSGFTAYPYDAANNRNMAVIDLGVRFIVDEEGTVIRSPDEQGGDFGDPPVGQAYIQFDFTTPGEVTLVAKPPDGYTGTIRWDLVIDRVVTNSGVA